MPTAEHGTRYTPSAGAIDRGEHQLLSSSLSSPIHPQLLHNVIFSRITLLAPTKERRKIRHFRDSTRDDSWNRVPCRAETRGRRPRQRRRDQGGQPCPVR